MGQVKEITITKGFTINLGNYQSKKIEVGMTLCLGLDEDIPTAYAWVISQLDNQLKKQGAKKLLDGGK